MGIKEKIILFEQLHSEENLNIELFYEVLEKCDALKQDYMDYMISEPVDCDRELERLKEADYDLCCALLTMLFREDHFCNGMFQHRQRSGQVKMVVERILIILKDSKVNKQSFSEKALIALNGYYVYALIDPRDNKVFYIGKGIGNRVFMHEIESGKSLESEKLKLKKIRDIENAGFSVKKLIVNWGLTESEAFASEATLINMLNYIPDIKLSNIVSGHHVHECLTTEQFEQMYGAVPLEKEDIKHSILVIKINKLYRRDMSEYELYDAVRGFWAASLKSIQTRKVKYVFGVYNGLIVAVYQPDEWHYGYEMIDIPQKDLLKPEDFERLKNRIYFVCNDYSKLDSEGKFYLHKSIENLKVNQSAQNPITYLMPEIK
ncbi:MAG: hypothetical protein IIV14_04045 [Bacteroidaceae bacterium]|nr:hypothetical protein [Bacteroidaceae bacterium]